MATTVQQLKHLEKQVLRLKSESAKMRRALREHGILPMPRITGARAKKMTERERVRELLRQAGMLAELTPEEKAMAAEWRALPEEEKKRIQDEFFNLKLDKPLSEIVIENRR